MDDGAGVWELVPLDDGVTLAVLDGEAPTLSDAVGVRELAWLMDPVGVVAPVAVALGVAVGVFVGVLALVRVCVGDGSRYSLRTRGPSSSSTDTPSPASAMCLGSSIFADVAGPSSSRPSHAAVPDTQFPAAVLSQVVPLISRRTHNEVLSEMSRSPLPSSANPIGFATFCNRARPSGLVARAAEPVPATVPRE